jgi:hypothetical protein
VEKGDDEKFIKATAGIPNDRGIIYLNSVGGMVLPGIGIATIIHKKGWSTYVPAGTFCTSMCANIWLGGNKRYITPTSLIGFHTISIKRGERWVRYEDGNAKMLDFYRDIGVSAKAGRIFMAADRNDITWLGNELAASLNINSRVTSFSPGRRRRPIAR